MEREGEDLSNVNLQFSNAAHIFDKLRTAGFIKDNQDGEPVDDTLDVITHVMPLEGVKLTDGEG